MPLPLPPSWRPDPRLRWWHPLVFLGMGMAAVLFGLAVDASAGLLAGQALFACGMGVQFLPRRGLGMESRDGALVVPASPLRAVVLPLGLVAHAAGLATGMGWGPSLALVALNAVPGALIVRRLGLLGDVRLDPHGVSLPTRERLSWEAAEVVAGKRGRITVGGVRLLAPRYTDPVALYWTLRFYAEHPGARDELADGRALDRVRRAQDEPVLLGIAQSVELV